MVQARTGFRFLTEISGNLRLTKKFLVSVAKHEPSILPLKFF